MPVVTNTNPFASFYDCQNTYLVFLKLEQDINNNIPVPFYFNPREKDNLTSSKSFSTNEEYIVYVNSTLKKSITDVLQNYGENSNAILQFPDTSIGSFGIADKNLLFYLIEVYYNSFKILFLVSYHHKKAILINYFKHDENYVLNESCCIPQLDFETVSQYTYSNNGFQYINTYKPYLDFKKKSRNSKAFWINVENFKNGARNIGTYSYYTLGNLIVVYGYQHEWDKISF